MLDNAQRRSLEARAQIMAVISAFTVCMLLLADESPSERTYWTCILYVAACVLMFVAQIKASACFYLPFLVVNGLHVLYGMWVLMNLVVFTIGVFRRPEDYEMLTAEGPTEVKASDIATLFTAAIIWSAATVCSEWVVYDAYKQMKNSA